MQKSFFTTSFIALPFIYLITWTFSFSYDFSDGIVAAAVSYQDGALDDGEGARANYKSGLILVEYLVC